MAGSDRDSPQDLNPNPAEHEWHRREDDARLLFQWRLPWRLPMRNIEGVRPVSNKPKLKYPPRTKEALRMSRLLYRQGKRRMARMAEAEKRKRDRSD